MKLKITQKNFPVIIIFISIIGIFILSIIEYGVLGGIFVTFLTFAIGGVLLWGFVQIIKALPKE